ncbi:MAG: hypothetical protein LBU85_07110 [Treponema sp.]|jgi:hypothetical protein|nr:hypothetical protein [Treponema sp.]
MEEVIYRTNKKHYIVDIKNLLNENNIPVSSIQLYISVNMDKPTGTGSGIYKDTREERNEIMIPIEEFNEKLNDAQTFEIYIEEEYYEKASVLIEEWIVKNFYKYCIYKSTNYDEADNNIWLLKENNIPCDDFPFTNVLEDNTEEYLIFIDPEYSEQANNLLNNNHKTIVEEINEYPLNTNSKMAFEGNTENSGSIRNILIMVILTLCIFFILYKFREKIPIIDKIFDELIRIINKLK